MAAVMSYEEIMAELTALTARMERGELPLAALLEEYNRGVELIKKAEKLLEKAEKKLPQTEDKA